MSINKIYRGRGQSGTPEEVGNTGGGGGGGSVSDFQVNYTISMDNTNRVVNEPIIVKAGTGDFTVSSSDSTVVTASVNNTTKVITLEGLKYGSAVITVTMAASGSYEACTKSIEVTSRCFVPTKHSSYVLGSGAHTAGSALPEAVCIDVDLTNMKALMQSKGVYSSTWSASLQNDVKSLLATYMGDFNSAIDSAYVPRAQNGATGPIADPSSLTGVSVRDLSGIWNNDFSTEVRQILADTAGNYLNIEGNVSGYWYSWTATTSSDTKAWGIHSNGNWGNNIMTGPNVIAPTFILDLTKVKLHGTLICLLTEPDMPALVPWSTGDDEDITAMVTAYYGGYLGLAEIQSVWSVGDKRTVSLSAMAAMGVGESHRAQDVEMQIIDFHHDNLTTAVNGKSRALITVDQKDCLMDAECAAETKGAENNTEKGYMNSTDTNVGGWNSCTRRTWCNSVYKNALPTYIKNLVKKVNKLSSAGNQSATIETTQDDIFLLSEIEIFGAVTKSKSGEGYQYKHYETTSNRYKKPLATSSSAYVSSSVWERSPDGSNAGYFGVLNVAGSASAHNASALDGLAPGMCI